MIKILFIIFLTAFSSTGICQSSVSENLSASIATKMKDSLGLTENQSHLVQGINRHLAAQKQSVFRRDTNRDSLRIHLQRIENMRDSLYSEVLPVEKYQLYKLKKRNLISNR